MNKLLFVSFSGASNYSGGKQCSFRNYKSLVLNYGEENVLRYDISTYTDQHCFTTKLQRVVDIFRGYMGGLNRTIEKDIKEIIRHDKIDILFIDSSLLGHLAMKIKRVFPKVKVVVFFHNTEFYFCRDYVHVSKDYLRFYWVILSYLNERFACKYAERIIVLNRRDEDHIFRLYKRRADSIIPISLEDGYTPEPTVERLLEDKPRTALFIGSNFFANVEGILWFCENVLPHVDIKLLIVGARMDGLKDKIQLTERVEIYSDVESLTVFYETADFMVLPIFSGSGMKVKTAESLMYGKYILGTSEALVGYEVSGQEAVCCNTKEEFIHAINNFSLLARFNQPSRVLFEKKYSMFATLPMFFNL